MRFQFENIEIKRNKIKIHIKYRNFIYVKQCNNNTTDILLNKQIIIRLEIKRKNYTVNY